MSNQTIVLYTADDLDAMARELEEGLAYRAEKLAAFTEQLQQLRIQSEGMAILDKYASIAAHELITENLTAIVTQEVLNACYQSVEYNYDLYVNHLLSAIDANLGRLITIKVPGHFGPVPQIKVDFTPLGPPELWFQAVDAVKKSGIGEKKLSFGQKASVELRSKMWAEKIYGSGREGRPVFRRRKKKNPQTGKKEVVGTYDITERYAPKYRATIEARLNKIPRNKAPFWYFLEFGNVGIGGRSGTPYPELTKPQIPMARNIEIILTTRYAELFFKYREEGEKLVKDTLEDKDAEEILEEDLIRYNQAENIDDYIENAKLFIRTVDGSAQRIIRESGQVDVYKRNKGGRFATQDAKFKEIAQKQRAVVRRSRRI